MWCDRVLVIAKTPVKCWDYSCAATLEECQRMFEKFVSNELVLNFFKFFFKHLVFNSEKTILFKQTFTHPKRFTHNFFLIF